MISLTPRREFAHVIMLRYNDKYNAFGLYNGDKVSPTNEMFGLLAEVDFLREV